MAKQAKHGKGELRRRWRRFMEDGSMAALRSEGRLAALYVFYAADWASCEVLLSARSVARSIGVHPTTVRRGLAQLAEAGLIVEIGRVAGLGKTRFVVVERAPLVRAPDTSGDRGRAHTVSTVDTPGVQSAHEPCPERAPPVSRARTLSARHSVLSIGRSVSTNGYTNQDQPDDGLGPPPVGHQNPAVAAAGGSVES